MDSFFIFIFKSCLKTEGDDCMEYYRLLDVDKRASQEDIRKAYRKASLQNHPDKLAQKGLEVTQKDHEAVSQK